MTIRSVFIPGFILDDKRLDYFEKTLYAYLLQSTSHAHPFSYITPAALGGIFHVKPSVVRRKLNKLESLRLIERGISEKVKYIKVVRDES